MSTKFIINPTRFIRQVATNSAQDKTNYVSIMQNMLIGLQNEPWKLSAAKIQSAGMPEHDFSKGPYIDDRYDAYKMCGLYNSSTNKYYGYAGCVAYRFKVPASYLGHYNASTCHLDTISIPVSRDRFLKTGFGVHVVASSSESPSTVWGIIHADSDASGDDITLHRQKELANQNSVTNLVDAMPLSQTLSVTLDATKASNVASKQYVWVYLTLNDYTDRWTRYNSKEARLYAIEGSASLTATDIAFDFTDTSSIIVPDEEPVNPTNPSEANDNKSLFKRIIYGTSGFVGAAAITIGALWYGGNDGNGDLIPDDWENAIPAISSIYDSAERARYAAAGDYMAYADIDAGILVASNKVTGMCRPYAYDSMAYPYISVGATLTNVEAKTAYPYGDTLGIGTNVILNTQYVVTGYSRNRSFRLVHFQVYDRFGYEQDVATERGTRHTKQFTALDKYLVARFMFEHGIGPGETNAAKYATSPLAYTTLVPGIIDYDNDSIPDGLELYMMFGPNAHSTSGNHLSPWNKEDGTTDFDNDGLSAAQELCSHNGTLNPWMFISDQSTVIDTYAYRYDIKSTNGAANDNDGDGLSNFSEYLISKVFGFSEIDPYQKSSSMSGVPDYFIKKGELYYGEIFTDHDQVDDAWERTYSEWANASVFDPDRDDDNDGWGNYYEYMSGTHPGKVYDIGPDGLVRDEMPIPICRANITYSGVKKKSGPIVVVAERVTDKGAIIDAKWTLGQNETSNKIKPISKNKYIGINPKKRMTYNTGSGFVVKGSFQAMFKVLNYENGHIDIDGNFVIDSYGSPSDAVWKSIISDRDGILYDTNHNIEVGTIDYENGLVDIDFCEAGLQEYRVVSTEYFKTNSIVDGNAVASVITNVTRMALSKAHVNMIWDEVYNNSLGVRYFSVADNGSDGRHGWLRGDASYTFSAFIDNDGNGTYTPGEPYGCAVGVSPGYDKCEFMVGLTDTISITPRFNIYNSKYNDRGTTFDESIKMLLSDRTKDWDRVATKAVGADTKIENTISNQVQVAEASAEKEKVHVRIVRFGMNDMFAYLLGVGYGGGYKNKPECLVKNIYLSNECNNIKEKLFYDNCEYDLDWTRLNGEVINNNSVISGVGNVTNVTYLAVLDGGKGHEYWIIGSYDSNTVIRCLSTPIERRFEKTKHAPVALNTGICYSARPTFRWSLPNEEEYAKKYGTSYTAFNLEIYGGSTANSNNLVYVSGIKRAPAQDANGVFTWTADMSADDMRRVNKVFSSTSNYCWRVAMYNAKFRETDADHKWSNAMPFSTAVNGSQEVNDHGYSSIDVAVRYAGHSDVIYNYNNLTTLNSKVRVQAFATADFAGDPLSEAVVTANVDNFADAALPNVRLLGLPATGTYYLRAYIDSNGNHALDDWESWGAASEPVVLTTDAVTAPVVGVWIEDSDTDGDWCPDALEYISYGDLTTVTANVKDGNSTLFGTAELASASNHVASLSTSLEGASLVIFENGVWANEILDWGVDNSTITFADINNSVMREAAMRQTYVRIDDATISDNGVVIFTTDKGKTAGDVINPRYYIVDPQTHNATIQFAVQRKSSLVEQNWEHLGYFGASINANDKTKTVNTGLTLSRTNYIYRISYDIDIDTEHYTALQYGDSISYKHFVGEMNLTSQEKSGLTYCRIGTDVKSIGYRCFNSCNSLQSIYIPDSITNISNYAITACGNITSIYIPKSVVSIGKSVLGGCSNIVSIIVDQSNEKYDSRDNCNSIIDKSNNALISGCKNTVIPNTVVKLNEQSFSMQKNLISIDIPSSVNTLESGCFQYCINLSNITCRSTTPPTCIAECFNGVTKSIPVYVPSTSVNAYRSATGWSSFTNVQAIP